MTALPTNSWERNAEKINDSLWYVNPNDVYATIASEREEAKREVVEEAIKYIRAGNVSGSFSEGCDCEKCDAYEKKVRKALNHQKQ